MKDVDLVTCGRCICNSVLREVVVWTFGLKDVPNKAIDILASRRLFLLRDEQDYLVIILGGHYTPGDSVTATHRVAAFRAPKCLDIQETPRFFSRGQLSLLATNSGPGAGCRAIGCEADVAELE